MNIILEKFHRQCWVVHKTVIKDLNYFSKQINRIEPCDLLLLVIIEKNYFLIIDQWFSILSTQMLVKNLDIIFSPLENLIQWT